MVTLKDLYARIQDVSDISNETFIRDVKCEAYTAKFVLEFTDPEDAKRDVYDEEFPIDSKSETINLEDMVVQAIGLQAPVMRIAP